LSVGNRQNDFGDPIIAFFISMEELLIFPFNGNAIEAIGCLGSKYKLLGFIDDEPEKCKPIKGFKIFSRSALLKYKNAKILVVPGSPVNYLKRHDVINSLNAYHHRFVSIIHPSAFVSPLAEIGQNVLIMAGVVITSNAKIGDNVCILPNSVIHHDVIVGDYTLIGSNVVIAGRTIIGNNCYIGSGSNIINEITLGKKTLVGLGSNVIRSFPDNSRIVGNPAKQII
jgi:sugar O-acyltransferase (sialic acid O-acetyltransferase NeuD family)